jgi:hypothetical protein
MKYTDDKIQQQIEAYLNQDMTDLDRSRFEKLIHDDPELHEEVKMQESLVQAIRNERILMIKAGLNQTNVSLWSTGLLEVAKIAAVTVGLGLASVGGYFWYSNSVDHTPARKEVAVQTTPAVRPQNDIQDATSEVAPPQTFQADPANGNVPVVPSDASAPPKTIGKNNVRTNQTVKSSGKVANGIGNDQQVLSETEALDPGMKQFVPSTAKDIAIPTDGISNKTSLESVNPEVVIKRDNKDKFHYQFSDSKLILYADFSDKLYEVLELNQNNEKQLFFAYDGRFFSLDAKQTEISPLKQVTDRNLIQILTDYQKRR